MKGAVVASSLEETVDGNGLAVQVELRRSRVRIIARTVQLEHDGACLRTEWQDVVRHHLPDAAPFEDRASAMPPDDRASGRPLERNGCRRVVGYRLKDCPVYYIDAKEEYEKLKKTI